MGKIHVLDKSVSNLIAAGEVVSRPASAVKELLENSMDAGAKSITVEIVNGGVKSIRVTDDGSGIEEDDILTAFMPHATSKIEKASDLEKIGTYGFRGEALASIAAVSKTELTTKTKDGDTGVRIRIEGGEIKESENVGFRRGTSITVRDLFFNTPARFKFLKKDSAEAAAVTDVCQKAALSRPDISIRYISSGKDVFFTPGDGVLLNAIFSVFGKDFAKHMIPVNYSEKNIKVKGFIGTAAVARPNRNMQIFFVNGRSVVSKIMSFALAEGFKNQLTVGKFPAAVLNIEIAPEALDVNVHPSKTEVKFTDEKAVYDAVYWGCKNSLYEKPYVPSVENMQSEKTESVKIHPEKTAESFSGGTSIKKDEFLNSENFIPQKGTENKNIKVTGFTPVKMTENPTNKPSFAAEPKAHYEVFTSHEKENTELPKQADVKQSEVQQEMNVKETENFRVAGQVFETYIIVEKGSDMLLIDQHAAHERLNFEALKKKRETHEASGQMFLIPQIASLEPSEMVLWEENREFLDSIGFDTDKMGERDIMIRSAPLGTDVSESADVILELLTILGNSGHDKRTYLEERAMYTVSCKAAIKANTAISKAEQEALAAKVMALDGINTCPHGRPICIKITKEKIEKEFKRI